MAARIGIVVAFACLWNLGPVQAQENDNTAGTIGAVLPQQLQALDWNLPIRPVYYWESQESKLIPEDYWPVSIEELKSALQRSGENVQPGIDRPLLSSAIYVATFEEGALVSQADASRLNVIFNSQESGRLRLGNVNLALDDASLSDTGPSGSRISTIGDGSLLAVLKDDTPIQFGWTRRGTLLPDGRHAFDLRFPICGRARLLIGVPDAYQLTTQAAVASRLPSPPPEVANIATDNTASWYLLEIGGLSRVRFSIGPSDLPRATRRQLPVREYGMDVFAEPSGTDWTMRMVADIPVGDPIPSLKIRAGGRITSIRINNEPTAWREVEKSEGLQVQITRPAPLLPSDDLATTIEVSGVAPSLLVANPLPFDSNGESDSNPGSEDTVRIPWVVLDDVEAVKAGGQSETLITLASPLKMISQDPSPDWKLEITDPSEASTRQQFRLTGPLLEPPPKLRVADPAPIAASGAHLDVQVNEASLAARWDCDLFLGPETELPLRLTFQRGWSVDEVLLGPDSRSLDIQESLTNEGQILVWPESDDIASGRLRLSVGGTLPLTPNRTVNVVPPTWFVRSNVPGLRTIATLQTDATLRCDPESILAGVKGNLGLLPKSLRASLDEDRVGLVDFDISGNATPSLRFRKPPSDYSVDLEETVAVVGSTVHEHIRVVVQTPSLDAPPIRIDMGPVFGRQPMDWRPVVNDGTDALNESGEIEIRRINVGSEDSEVWEFIPRATTRESIVLHGVRQFSLTNLIPTSASSPTDVPGAGVRLQLPRVLTAIPSEASNNSGKFFVDTSLPIIGMSDNVGKVDIKSITPDSLVESRSATRSAIGTKPFWSLKYIPDQSAFVELDVVDRKPDPVLVWQQEMEVLAGMTGDQVRVKLFLQDRRDLKIKYPQDMQLKSVDGATQVNDSEGVQELTLRAPSANEPVSLHWFRPTLITGGIREFTIPEIEVNGTVVDWSCEVWTSTGTRAFSLGAHREPPNWMRGVGQPFATGLEANSSLTLYSSNLCRSVCCGIGILCFLVGYRFIPRWSLTAIAAFTAMVIVALAIPSWTETLLAYTVLPWTAAGLMGSCFTPLSQQSQRSLTHPSISNPPKKSATRETAPTSSDSPASPEEADPRASTVIRNQPAGPGGAKRGGSKRLHSILWLCAVSIAGSQLSYAQEEDSRVEQAANSPIEVLIPLDENGEIGGGEVYIPKPLIYQLLRRPITKTKSSDVEFLSAQYQIRVSPLGMGQPLDQVSIDATWRVKVDSIELPIRIPVLADVIDRITTLTDATGNEVRPIPDGDGVLFRLPRTGINVIQATLTPDVELTAAGANRLSLSVPIVASAAVVVSAESPFDQVNLPNCLGQLNRSTSGNRVTARLGPVKELELIWQRRGAAASGQWADIDRRIWIHVGPRKVIREVELDLGRSIRAGVVVELETTNQAIPFLTTADWSLASSATADSDQIRMRMVANVDAPGPIRVLWSEDAAQFNLNAIPIPNLRPTSMKGTIPTTIGFDLPADWELAMFATTGEQENQISVVEPNVFFANWFGHGGNVSASREFTGATPLSVAITPASSAKPDVTETHQLFVFPERSSYAYACTIEAGSIGMATPSIQLPKSLRFESLEIDGARVESASIETDAESFNEIFLPSLQPNEVLQVKVVGSRAAPFDTLLELPLARISGKSERGADYELHRSSLIRLEESAASFPDSLLELPTDAQLVDLENGTTLVKRWSISAADDDSQLLIGLPLQIKPAATLFNSRSLTALRWEDGFWSLNAQFQMDSETSGLDFITFAIPSQWEQSLDIRPTLRWYSESSNESGVSLVRVIPDSSGTAPGEDRSPISLVLTSRLESTSEGGVRVPDLKVLGSNSSERYIATPRRLTNNAVTWSTQNASEVSKPEGFIESTIEASTHRFYKIDAETFSIALQPTSAAEESARVSVLELDILPRRERNSLILMRAQVLPGDLDGLELQVPKHFHGIAAFAGGIPIPMRSEEPDVLFIPLAISRLPQQISVILHCEALLDSESVKAPMFRNVPVESTWISVLQPSIAESSDSERDSWILNAESQTALLLERWDALSRQQEIDGWSVIPEEAYRQRLTSQLMKLLEQSVDSVAERPLNERGRWLAPWLQRLESLGQGTSSEWAGRFKQQVLGNEPVPSGEQTAPYLDPSSSAHNRTDAALRVFTNGPASSIPTDLFESRPHPKTAWIMGGVGFSVGLLMLGLLATLRRYTGNRWSQLPETWWIVLGISMLPIAPLPIAMASIAIGASGVLLRRWG